MTSYDAIIIGTGQAGPALARGLAGAGMKVAVVDATASAVPALKPAARRPRR